LAPISGSSERRSTVTNFELLVLGQDAPSIILGLPSLALLGIGVFRLPTSHPSVAPKKPLDDITLGYSSANDKEVFPAAVSYEECLRYLRSNKVTSDSYFNYLTTFRHELLIKLKSVIDITGFCSMPDCLNL
jgi:hypothetical protein